MINYKIIQWSKYTTKRCQKISLRVIRGEGAQILFCAPGAFSSRYGPGPAQGTKPPADFWLISSFLMVTYIDGSRAVVV